MCRHRRRRSHRSPDLVVPFLLGQRTRCPLLLTGNLSGDILSDLAAVVAGSIGIAPAANLTPERDFPSMFVWSAAMVLDRLGHPRAAKDVTDAIAAVLAKTDTRTRDLGGTSTKGGPDPRPVPDVTGGDSAGRSNSPVVSWSGLTALRPPIVIP